MQASSVARLAAVAIAAAGLSVGVLGWPRIRLWLHMLEAEYSVLARRYWQATDYHDRDMAYPCETGTRRVNVLFYQIPRTLNGKPTLIDEQFMRRFRYRFAQVDPSGKVKLTARFVDHLDCALVVPTAKGHEASIVVLPFEALGLTDENFPNDALVRLTAVAFADRPDPRLCPEGGASKQPIDPATLARHRLSFGRYRLIDDGKAVRIDPTFLDGRRVTTGTDWWAAATFAGGCYWYPRGGDLKAAIGALRPTRARPQRVIAA